MSNPGGANQLGSYELQPKYGDVKRLTQLQRQAPISGAPLASSAINTPRRSQKQAVRGQTPQEAQAPPLPQQAPSLPPEQLYSMIAAIPGASPEVQRIFGAAEQRGT